MESETEHALACALYGDCIYDVVQEGASDLEKQWKALTKPWKALLEKSVRGRFFGFGAPVVDSKWLLYVLHQPTRMWPKGLGLDEIEVLELARAATGYNSLANQGLGRSDVSPTDPATNEQTLQGLRKFSTLFRRKVALPMWKAYNDISDKKARQIMPMCEATYGESCSLPEAREMFQGDLERGLKVKSLNVGPTTYQVLPKLLSWISV